ncbi:hypothetical protein [Parapedobacter sp. DT-150]|uniref:hypothetical protein n=1 Tax=Parapedobacter sp. DT-150 TaxID=3396162 RepID=UPI003F1CA1AB
MSNIREFFNAYAVASTGGNAEKIAAFYGDSFVVVAPGESRAFRNDEEFLKWLQSVHEFNRQTGLRQMLVQHVTEEPFGGHAIHASVTWGALYEKTGDEAIAFTIHYILQQQASSLRIILYSSEEDQEKAMKEKGLL